MSKNYVELEELIDKTFGDCVEFLNSEEYIPANKMVKLIKLVEAFGVYQNDEK